MCALAPYTASPSSCEPVVLVGDHCQAVATDLVDMVVVTGAHASAVTQGEPEAHLKASSIAHDSSLEALVIATAATAAHRQGPPKSLRNAVPSRPLAARAPAPCGTRQLVERAALKKIVLQPHGKKVRRNTARSRVRSPARVLLNFWVRAGAQRAERGARSIPSSPPEWRWPWWHMFVLQDE